ncbi:MAG: UDP-N-acetylmuramoyl-L-alanine--D-glutamate ligase [Pseudomonadota bacterium]
MIPVTTFAGKRVLLFGLGGSGLATAEAFVAGGAEILCFDDNAGRVTEAQALGLSVGDLRDVDFSDYDALILSPGVPLTHPHPHWSVEKARAASIEIIGDVEVFARERRAAAPDCPFVAITGTNGKSTTTALIHHCLKAAGRDSEMGGNIGRAVLTLDPPSPNRHYVVECSSYQIDLAPTLDPSIGVHLNLSPDHLDRHGTFEHYANVIARLVYGSQTGIVGVDDQASHEIAKATEGRGVPVIRVALKGVADIEGRDQKVLKDGQVVADLEGIVSLRGEHNLQNAAIAWAVLSELGLTHEEIRAGFRGFGGLAHRMEQVAEKCGVLFINDSKATNAEAAARALASFDGIYWILGGVSKEGGIESLNHFFPKIRHAFLIGDASDLFAKSLSGHVAFTPAGTLESAVEGAARMAIEAVENGTVANPVVLLSPACASFDQFANFEVRGDRFREAVVDALQAL